MLCYPAFFMNNAGYKPTDYYGDFFKNVCEKMVDSSIFITLVSFFRWCLGGYSYKCHENPKTRKLHTEFIY